MATLDPDLGACLESLLETPLAALAREVVDLIVQGEQEGVDDGPAARDGWWTDRDSRSGQLEIAHRIISGRIKRQIAMLQRLRELAPTLGIEGLRVLPDAEASTADHDGADMLDSRREEGLLAFLEAWGSIRDDLRTAWNTPDGR